MAGNHQSLMVTVGGDADGQQEVVIVTINNVGGDGDHHFDRKQGKDER